jgi:hypothetical protein
VLAWRMPSCHPRFRDAEPWPWRSAGGDSTRALQLDALGVLCGRTDRYTFVEEVVRLALGQCECALPRCAYGCFRREDQVEVKFVGAVGQRRVARIRVDRG